MKDSEWISIPERLHEWESLAPRPIPEVEEWVQQTNADDIRVRTYTTRWGYSTICFFDDAAKAEFILRFGPLT